MVSALDHRFGWSSVPTAICVAGFVLTVIAIWGITVVFAQNSHAAVTVRVEEDQPLISSGVYGMVRHPMYTFITLMSVGAPLALGSYWGLVAAIPTPLVFALRIRDEEDTAPRRVGGLPALHARSPASPGARRLVTETGLSGPSPSAGDEPRQLT